MSAPVPAPPHPVRRTVIAAVLALVIAFALYQPFDHWALRPDLLAYIVPAMITGQLGYPALAGAIFLMIWVPAVQPAAQLLARRQRRGTGAERARAGREEAGPPAAEFMERGSPADPASAGIPEAQPPGDLAAPSAAPPEEDPEIAIPSDLLVLLTPPERIQLARAIDLPWTGRMSRDDEMWERACIAALRRAARAQGGPSAR